MSSNLPPGCSSPDGGIDHAMESALDDLCNDIQCPEEAYALRAVLPAIRDHMQNSFDAGVQQGRLAAEEDHDIMRRTWGETKGGTTP